MKTNVRSFDTKRPHVLGKTFVRFLYDMRMLSVKSSAVF